MQTKRYEFLLESTSPIAVSSGSIGNKSPFFRRKAVRGDRVDWVPVIPASTLRHGLREAIAWVCLHIAGVADQGALTRDAMRLLFNGGALRGRGDGGSVSLDRYQELVTINPSLAILGGCTDGRIVPGQSSVEDALLVCEEHQPWLPTWVQSDPQAQLPESALRERVIGTRMDSCLEPTKTPLLTGDEQVALVQEQRAREQKRANNEHTDDDEGKSSMMPHEHVAIARGARWSFAVTATCKSELDVDTLNVMLGAFFYSAMHVPTVGGKKGIGHGMLRVLDAREVKFPTWSERISRMLPAPAETQAIVLDQSALPIERMDNSPRMGEVFARHMTEHADQFREWLGRVKA